MPQCLQTGADGSDRLKGLLIDRIDEMGSLQIRIRTDQPFEEILCIRGWLEETSSGFAFNHNKPNNNHYHIYLFGFDKAANGIRKTLSNYYSKTCYSVSITAGKKKEKILPILAYQYGTEDKLLEPIWVKGFSEENLDAFKANAKEHYEAIENDKRQTVTKITREEHYVVRPDRVWERLYGKYRVYREMSIVQIKSKIAVEWLNNGKAIPRPSDLHRYAVSLYMLNKYNNVEEIPEHAMVEHFSA